MLMGFSVRQHNIEGSILGGNIKALWQQSSKVTQMEMLEFPGPVQFCFISLYLQILYLSILKRRIQLMQQVKTMQTITNFIANLQNICKLIGRGEYNIGYWPYCPFGPNVVLFHTKNSNNIRFSQRQKTGIIN